MSSLVKQPLSVLFGAVDQRKNEKALIPGQILAAFDVDQRTKKGVYEKRLGFAAELSALNRFAPGVGGASYLYDHAGMCALSERETLLRTKTEVLLSGPNYSANTAYLMGQSRPISVREAFASPNGSHVASYYHAANDTVVVFYRDDLAASTDGYSYRVFDRTSGYEIHPETRIDPGVAHGRQSCVLFAGGSLWFLTTNSLSGGNSQNQVLAYKFNPLNWAAAPVKTTAWTTAASTIYSLDAAVIGAPYIVIGGNAVGGFADGVGIAEFDTSTGLVKGSPAPAFQSVSSGHAQVTILRGHDGSSNAVYVSGLSTSWTVTRSPLLSFTAAVGNGATVVNVNQYTGVMGYTPDNGVTRVVYVSGGVISPPTTNEDEVSPVGRATIVGGVATTTNNWSPGGLHPAVRPFKIGTQWYVGFLTGDPNRLQRALYIAEASPTGAAPTFVARALYQRAGAPCGAGRTTEFSGGQRIIEPTISGTTMLAAFPGGGIENYGASWIELNFDATLGNPVPLLGGDLAALPGAWPAYVSGRAAVVEPPVTYPRYVSAVSAGSGSITSAGGSYRVQINYVAITKDGRYFESAPSPVLTYSQTTSPGSVNVTFPTPRLNNYAEMYCAIYFSAAGGSSLTRQRLVKCVRSATTQTVNITSLTTTGPAPYWTGGAIMDKLPPPPAQHVFTWRDREFRTASDDGTVWHSSRILNEYDAPTFNDGLMSFAVSEGTGPVVCGGAVDFNFAALFKRDGVWLLTGGEGPDSTGRGAYVPARVAGEYGCTNARSLATCPLGLVFQGIDGGIYLIDRTGTVQFIGAGVWDHKQYTVSDATHDESGRRVFFALAGISRVLVWDYGSADETAPLGCWTIWRLPTVPAIGCTMKGARLMYAIPRPGSGRALYVQTDSTYYDETESGVVQSPILPRVDLQLNLAGLQGYGRLYRGALLGQVYGNSSVQLTVTPGYTGGTPEVFPAKAMTPGDLSADFRPGEGKATAHRLTVEEIASGNLTRGFSLEGIALEVGIKPGIRRTATRLG